jgi:hypothetical protein
MSVFISKIYALYNYYCKFRLNQIVPGVQRVIDDYSSKSQSTGTKYPTLYRAVKSIYINKPKWILECGTGTSTLVLAEAILMMQKTTPSYQCKIISMESIPKWNEMANHLLPKKYCDIVEICLGEREKYEYSMFRGFSHSNVPQHPYDFVFLDGPSYNDENGASTCMDAIKIRLTSDAEVVSCVIDTRVSSVFMMQQVFGAGVVKYFPIFRTCAFNMPRIDEAPTLSSVSFSSSVGGRLSLKSTFIEK